jgi:putative acetyltransferase
VITGRRSANDLPVTIGPEGPGDAPGIRALHDEAFRGPVEGAIVDALRGTEDWIEGGSIVALDTDGSLVGHVLLSIGWLTRDDGSTRPIWMLGPIGVRPDRQLQGVGAALMRAAITLAIERQQPVICLVGHADYYPRFGFQAARSMGIQPPHPTWADANWLALRLPAWTPDLRGTATFAPPFAD